MATFPFTYADFTDDEIAAHEDEMGLTFLSREEGDIKCGGCGWETRRLYVRAEEREKARQMVLHGEGGMCGECYAQYLAEGAA